MSTSDYDVRSTDDINFDDATATGGDRARDMRGKVGGLVNRGIDTVKDQYRVVREQGMQGVKDDVVGYAKREPMKALLLAGGIGALAAMILRRR
jgi:ElaB/YqjD/DUF883 family membrane-anchored ribosome-binding protein